MNAPISLQTITGPDGEIQYVVVPYAEYLRLSQKAEGLIPNAVINLKFKAEQGTDQNGTYLSDKRMN